jgi:hypothetical protein
LEENTANASIEERRSVMRIQENSMLSVRNWFLGCCLMLLLSVPELAGAQTLDALQKLEVIDVPLVAWVTSREHALPNTLADFAEPEDVSNTFRSLVDVLSAHNWASAGELARRISYRVVALKEGDARFVIASDESKTGRNPILVLNTAARREIILEAPHVPFEPGTGEQAVTLLRDLAPRRSQPARSRSAR